MRPLIFTLLTAILLSACRSHESSYIYKYPATKDCKNMSFYAAYLFSNEQVQIRLDNKLIFQAAADTLDGYRMTKSFCLPQSDSFLLSVKTIQDGKTYIDTIITAYPYQGVYHLNITIPQPLNWPSYYQEGVPVKKWGYLPIDSCVRLVSLIPDTVYKDMFSCEVL